mgnify:CR=1 FL=1
MSTATVLNSSGVGFLITNDVLDSDGNSFAVDNYALDSDGNSFLIFLAIIKQLNTGGGADASDTQGEDEELVLMIIKAYMKHTL